MRKGWAIIRIALFLTIRRRGAAIRLTASPMLLGAAGAGLFLASAEGERAFVLALGVLCLIASGALWARAGVRWHRLALADDPEPPQAARLAFRYWLWGAGVLLLLVLFGALVGFSAIVASTFGARLGEAAGAVVGMLATLGVMLAVTILSLRLSVILPSVAMQGGHGLGEALAITKGETAALALVAAAQVAASLLVELPFVLLRDVAGAPNAALFAYGLGFWAYSVFSLSVLTALYGCYAMGMPFALEPEERERGSAS